LIILANSGDFGQFQRLKRLRLPRNWGPRRKGVSVFRREDRYELQNQALRRSGGTSAGAPAGGARESVP